MPNNKSESFNDSDREASQQRQREYYNSAASVYDIYYHNKYATAYRKELYEEMVGHIDLRGKLVLDAMCGGGENTGYFLSRGAVVQGLDISDEQCKTYVQNYPDCKVDQGSIMETPYPDDHFDFVVVESLHHLHPHVADGMREILRVLKPGGHLLIWEPSAGSLLDLFRKIWYRIDKSHFLESEKSIDLRELVEVAGRGVQLEKSWYGGNFGFIFVFSGMHLRMPVKLIGYYAPLFMVLERVINKIQGKFLACWMMALFKKAP